MNSSAPRSRRGLTLATWFFTAIRRTGFARSANASSSCTSRILSARKTATSGSILVTETWTGPPCGNPCWTSTIPAAPSPNSRAAIRRIIFSTSTAGWTVWSSVKPKTKRPPKTRGPSRKTEKLNQRLRPVLESLFHFVQKLMRDGAVHHSVVIAQRDIAHRADGDGIVDDHGPLFNRAEAENADVRLADDRQSEQSAEHTRIRDRKRPFLYFFRL